MQHDSPWPAVTYEQLEWESSPGAHASRKQRMLHRGPYASAVPPHIAGQSLNLSASTLLELEEASQELVRFDARHTGAVGPLAALLLRSESAASSQIENLTSSARSVAIAEIGEPSGPNAKLIVGNARAMQAAIELADRMDEVAIIEMHAALLGESRPDAVGAWRQQAVWIGGSGLGPHRAVFVPPRRELVPDLMADLAKFIARDDLPVLVQAALAHAQFETIHPFVDGNGRTGRALLHAMLRSKGLLQNITIPVSAGLLADTTRYFASLSEFQQGDPEGVSSLVAEAAFRAVSEATWLLGEVGYLMEEWRQRLGARRHALVWTVLEELPRQPVLSTRVVERRFTASNTAASRALQQLSDAGIMREFTGKRRSRMWVADGITELLDEFGRRAVMRRL